MSSVTFQGITISRQDVLRILAAFDAAYRDDSNAYEGWLDKSAARYALEFEGRLYPPRHILSTVTGIVSSDLDDAEKISWMFRLLGFDVVRLDKLPESMPYLPDTVSDKRATERLVETVQRLQTGSTRGKSRVTSSSMDESARHVSVMEENNQQGLTRPSSTPSVRRLLHSDTESVHGVIDNLLFYPLAELTEHSDEQVAGDVGLSPYLRPLPTSASLSSVDGVVGHVDGHHDNVLPGQSDATLSSYSTAAEEAGTSTGFSAATRISLPGEPQPEYGHELEPDDIGIPISVLDLSVRPYNALVRSNVRTVVQLARMSDEDLFRIRNLGQKSVDEIREVLTAYLEEHPISDVIGVSAEQDSSRADVGQDTTQHNEDLVLEPDGKRTLLEVLELPVRAHNALVRSDITTVGQLARMSEEDILKVRNLGMTSLGSIAERLGVYLRNHPLQPVRESNETAAEPSAFELEGLNSLLIDQDLLLRADHIPLKDISLTRLALSPSAAKELLNAGIRSMDDLTENTLVILTQSTIEEVRDRADRYFTWLLEQGENTWENEMADRGISPLHRVELEGATIEEMITDWFSFLKERQQFVLRRRFGLVGQVQTLEEVGQELGVKRERVRQIEKRGLEHLDTPSRRAQLMALSEAIIHTLSENAGVMRPQALLGSLTRNYGVRVGSISLFGLLSLIAKVFGQVEISKRNGIVFLTSIALQDILAVQRKLVAILRESDKPLSRRDLLKLFKRTDLYQESSGGLSDDFIVACLRSSTLIERDDTGHYALGMSSWRRKFFVIRAMRSIGEPIHYSEIAARFNELVSERQRLSDYNLHAYLDRLPKLFVRVGRGVYGLAEWGLHDDGDLAGAAYRVLSDEGQPLHIDTITDRVLENWRAGRNSVYAAVYNDDRFFRAAPATFGLIDWEIERLNERQPLLNICPPPLPDRVGERDTFFESVLVAHEVLKGHRTVSEFLEKMLEWVGTVPEKSARYVQNVLNAYYVVGLIPYTLYRYSEDATLTSVLPDTNDLQQIRSYCLQCMIERLARMKDFLSILYFRQPCTRDELRDWFYEPDAPIDDVKNRVRLLYNLSMLLREPSGRYRLSPFGETNLKAFGIGTSSQISSIFVEPIELQRVVHDTAIGLIDF